MSELQDVLRAIEEGAARARAWRSQRSSAIHGSTYRREGARLAIPAEGSPVGTISGGCLEGEVCQIAGDVMAEGTTRLLHYDLTADDEAVWGWGLGCNGVIDVFVEPAERALEMVGRDPPRHRRAARAGGRHGHRGGGRHRRLAR